jgi:hypothetical protein
MAYFPPNLIMKQERQVLKRLFNAAGFEPASGGFARRRFVRLSYAPFWSDVVACGIRSEKQGRQKMK